MNIKEIKEMIALMNENGLTEMELEKNGVKIRLKKGLPGHVETITEQDAAAAPALKRLEHAKPSEKFRETVEVKAPMVGTFYASPAPEAPPYVEIGSRIQAGDVVCVIEAMKLMNEIKSEVRGKVVEVMVENGSPIEFGQILFLVEPS